MEVLKENPSELDLGSSTESFQKLLDSQKELFHSQIDQLQNIVVTQCKLTGVNPLSQEMAAGALSIKIGKRPRDLLNPKAVKYMQSVFSIKDAISKKESREISALFGVTVTQVREFFTSQRSRVRKLVRLSREKAIRSNNACKELQDGVPTSSDPMIPIDQVPLNSVGPAGVEEAPSCSTQDETLPGIDDSDKHFLENIFSLMRKEETFSGQVKLMEWILQIENSSVLYWFLTRGGVMILATWLSQAAIEEQTSVLVVILKVLCHLPLHKALPVHMSAILQSVNRLRFYRTSDISNRARVLLSRWSKIFARSQAWKKPNVMKSSSDPQKERLSCQRIGEIMGDESWQSKIDLPEEILAPSYSSENFRKLESPQALKLLPASTDDSNRKHIRGVSSSQTRERRKVLLVEQPGQKTASRSMQVARAVPANQGRPMSADDIQKAKMRALFMQSKYGKTAISSNESLQAKTEGLNRSSSSQTSILLSAPKAHVQPKIEEREKPVIIPSNSNQREAPLDSKPNLDLKEPLWEKCKRVQIPWQTPPELRINGVWRVGGGENSKDVEVQKNRIRREKEIIYQTVQEIPSDPKEPWDLEMDYDDTLTPEIPTVQLPDGDGTETLVSPREDRRSTVTPAATSSSQIGSASASVPEPDLELLAILLKNPELVFALTSGQGGGLSSEETVRLLDMIKTSGMGLQGTLNGLSGKAEEMVEVSLPSPTPSSNPGTSGWKPEVAKNPFSQRSSMANRDASAFPGVAATIRAPQNVPSTSMVWPQISTANITPPPPQPATVSQFSQRFPATMPPFSLPQTTTVLPKKRPPSLIPSLHQRLPTNSAVLQTPASEIVLSMTNFAATNSTLPNFSAAASPSLRVETLSNVKPAPVSIILNTPERQPITFPLPPLLPTPTRSQPHPQPPVVPEPPVLTPLYPTRSIGKPGSVSDSWSERQGLASNPHTQVNQNNYNAWAGGSMQPPMLPGPPWERNEFVGEAEFETWSPEGSPIRSPEYMSGRNFLGPRMNSERNYRPERSRLRSSSGYRDQNRHGNRRWRDRRR